MSSTSLIAAVENLIKREKGSPSKVKTETKSSTEILSELFGVFNATPPEIRESPERKKRSKKDKKHKKEKKRSRRGSSYSDDSEKRHRRRKKKSKRRRSTSRSLTPPLRSRSRSCERKPKLEKIKRKKYLEVIDLKVKPERIKDESKDEIKAKIRKISSREDDKHLQTTIKNEDTSKIPMPEEPRLSSNDLRLTLESKHAESEAEKSKSNKIQIKNLKFSAVFEETVKQAEEEARRKAEQCEEGEYTDSSSGSRDHSPDNAQFPKIGDPCRITQTKTDDNKSEERSSRDKDRSRSTRKECDSSRRSHKKDKTRERSRSKRRSRSHSRHRSRSRDKKKSSRRSRSKSYTRSYSRRHNNLKLGPRKSRSPGVRLGDSEKRRLLEVARRNAINMLKNGAVPAAAAALPPHTRHQVMAAIQSGGKSVDELTDFCKHLSKKEALGELSSVSSNDSGSENEDTLAFHHPFLVKEKAPIVMNIRGGAPLPVKTGPLAIVNKEELRLQFPVSSGSQHRGGEREWRAVTPPPSTENALAKLSHKHPPRTTASIASTTASGGALNAALALPAPTPPPMPSELPVVRNTFLGGNVLTSVTSLSVPGPQAYPPGIEPAPSTVDIGSIVTQKLQAIRMQSEKEMIPAASGVLARAVRSTLGMRQASKLGAFTGSTGANILSPRELASGCQAWAKKDQLTRAAPVEGGMGMHLLQKMGWTPGKGLGKEETGTLQPLLLEVKLDTRGLQAKEEGKKPQRGGRRTTAASVAAAITGVSGKHPVSLLGEYCSKRKLGPPEYELCFECGPDHKKNFLFKVKVAGIEYQPAVASANKKQAKADSAQIALQKLGVLP